MSQRAEARALAAELHEIPADDSAQVTGNMSAWASVRYFLTVRGLAQNPTASSARLKTLRAFCRDLIALRRGDNARARTQIEPQRRATRPAAPIRDAGAPACAQPASPSSVAAARHRAPAKRNGNGAFAPSQNFPAI